VLLGLAGFSMARFLLDSSSSEAPAPRVLRGAARIAVPSVLWISLVALVSSQYSWANGLLLGTVLGPESWGPAWHFWFVEALVLYLLLTAALLVVPAIRRAERAHPFAVAGALVAVGLLIRFGMMPGLAEPRPSPAPAIYFFLFFAIGWWAARASTRWQRLLVSAVILLAVPGFWDAPMREAAVALGLLLLLWFPTLRVPRASVTVFTRVAAASLAIYLTHWLVFPPMAQLPLLALVTSLAVGVVGYELVRLAMKVAKSRSFWSAYADAYAANARSARSLLPR
jgi:surface polysaccharide O-acyltransferase-like enzyme